jgi:hypothetical protein
LTGIYRREAVDLAMKVAVIGAGAIGGLVGARLALAG